MERSGICRRCRNNDGIVHRAVFIKSIHNVRYRGLLLTDGDVNTDNALALLVNDGIRRDDGLTRLTVTDDQLTLTSADRDHGVDRLDTRLQRHGDGFSFDNTVCLLFDRSDLSGFDRSLGVDRLSERVHNASDHRLTDGDGNGLTRTLDEDTEATVEAYMPDPARAAALSCDGLVQPYGDFPVDSEILAENVYLNIINQATDYVYVYTPYVVIDYEMTRALSLAARRGVDVRLVVPGVPDKKIVYALTKSYFPELMENGVKVYRFTPGFVHSKVFVADDRLAVVGSINLDYRSLVLHFENACMFVDHPVIPAVKTDFEETFPRCELVTVKKRRFNVLYDIYLGLLRLFAPLL